MGDAVKAATARLAAAGVPSPDYDARALAAHLLGVRQLVSAPQPPTDFAQRYEALVARRADREPLQLILGTAAFRYLEIPVRPGVFIPRPETELVAGAAIDAARAQPSPLVLDLCAGSGAIALALAQEVAAARVIAVEISPDAVQAVRAAAASLGLAVQVREGDATDAGLLADLAGHVDVLVSNPPYLPDDGAELDPEVREHDPRLALYGGGEAGTAMPLQIIRCAAVLLRPGGVLVMEHDVSQGAFLASQARRCGFENVQTHRDLTGRERYFSAELGAMSSEVGGGGTGADSLRD